MSSLGDLAMSKPISIYVIVEGPTESNFIREVVAPSLSYKNIFMTAIVSSKKGQKGGDIRFERMKKDFRAHLKQRSDSYVTMMVDFYGTKEWPMLEEARSQQSHIEKSKTFCEATMASLKEFLGDNIPTEQRFIPYVAMHEFEALLFSEPTTLAEKLNIKESVILDILKECGEPEQINDSPMTAPSKRLHALSPSFKKTSTGIAIAKEIGLDIMREKCPLFDQWLSRIEQLK